MITPVEPCIENKIQVSFVSSSSGSSSRSGSPEKLKMNVKRTRRSKSNMNENGRRGTPLRVPKIDIKESKGALNLRARVKVQQILSNSPSKLPQIKSSRTPHNDASPIHGLGLQLTKDSFHQNSQESRMNGSQTERMHSKSQSQQLFRLTLNKDRRFNFSITQKTVLSQTKIIPPKAEESKERIMPIDQKEARSPSKDKGPSVEDYMKKMTYVNELINDFYEDDLVNSPNKKSEPASPIRKGQRNASMTNLNLKDAQRASELRGSPWKRNDDSNKDETSIAAKTIVEMKELMKEGPKMLRRGNTYGAITERILENKQNQSPRKDYGSFAYLGNSPTRLNASPKIFKSDSCFADVMEQSQTTKHERKLNLNTDKSPSNYERNSQEAQTERADRTREPKEQNVFSDEIGSFFKLNKDNKILKELEILYRGKDVPWNAEQAKKRRMASVINIQGAENVEVSMKPVAIKVTGGKDILQPEYMKHIGSMCFTELWSVKETSKATHQLKDDATRVRNLPFGREDEISYKPTKWKRENQMKMKTNGKIEEKGVDKNREKSGAISERQTVEVQESPRRLKFRGESRTRKNVLNMEFVGRTSPNSRNDSPNVRQSVGLDTPVSPFRYEKLSVLENILQKLDDDPTEQRRLQVKEEIFRMNQRKKERTKEDEKRMEKDSHLVSLSKSSNRVENLEGRELIQQGEKIRRFFDLMQEQREKK